MKQFIRDYFTFNKRERSGVIVLLVIIGGLLTYLSVSKYFFTQEQYDFSEFEKEVGDFQKTELAAADSLNEIKYTYSEVDYKLPSKSKEEKKAERFPFNPNNLPESNWKRLGLSDRQISSIKKYESKGGRFGNKEDLKKMYVISPELYASLEPYIQIPTETTLKNEKEILVVKNEYHPEKLLVELNSADTVMLDRLKGIGPAFAKRILKYREILGGYVKKEQLMEVYGFDAERYDGLAENVTVDATKAKKININAATAEEMKKHPYIRYNLANLIVSYRRQHGNYRTVEDIKKLDLVTGELFVKLAPYLTVE
jgi:competence ComEA-like helix-hairpin-helix protein